MLNVCTVAARVTEDCGQLIMCTHTHTSTLSLNCAELVGTSMVLLGVWATDGGGATNARRIPQHMNSK